MNPDMDESWIVRPYAAGDRAAVRRICCDTADAGRPVEAFFEDRELIADLLMNYYTDFEPESAWVVEQVAGPVTTGGPVTTAGPVTTGGPVITGGPADAGEVVGRLTGCFDKYLGHPCPRFRSEVVGYLTGCCDTGRFGRIMFWRIAPVALIKALFRGTWWSPSARRLIRDNLTIWLRLLGHRKTSLAGYPAHLHINLMPGGRGHGVGRQLIDRFLARLRARGIPGVHLSSRTDNMAAIGFFEKMGFTRIDQRPFLRVGPGIEDMRYAMIMARKINAE